ncbi:hypothetical protein ACFQ3W_25635 [Paenibacillus puldeungensis]|uniref:Uncharacterized protein n=1 Tax=Paenibacillus puldeungensis TaxID=696536 RepID=A0ABW3S6S8_9BACL
MKIKTEIYNRLFKNECVKHFPIVNGFDFETHKKLVFWGVKLFGRGRAKPKTIEEAALIFNTHTLIFDLIGLMTPRQLMTLFPIDKDYDGDKYQTKDYFYTMDVCIKHGLDTKIGDAFDFLWDYQNWDIAGLVVEHLSITSDIRKFEGYPGLLEEFAAKNGLKTYQMREMNGSTVLIENLVITEDGKVL